LFVTSTHTHTHTHNIYIHKHIYINIIIQINKYIYIYILEGKINLKSHAVYTVVYITLINLSVSPTYQSE